jgi:hypothetical protein
MKKFFLVIFIGTISLCHSYGQSEVKLSSNKFYNGKLEIMLPDSFQLMKTESITQMDPSQGWPNMVFMNNSRNISIEMMLPNQGASDGIIPVIKDVLKDAMSQKYPSAIWKGDGVEIINGRNVGYFELITKSGTTEMYNLMFLSEVDGKLFSCSILFPVALFENWISVGKEIMRSVKVLN